MTADDTQTGVRLSDLTQPRWQTYREVAEAVRDDAPEAQRALAGYLSNASYDVERLTRERDDAIKGRDDLPMSHVLLAQLKTAEAENERLRAAADALIEWDERWPENRIHSATHFKRCHDELADCIAAFRAALAGGVGDTAAASLMASVERSTRAIVLHIDGCTLDDNHAGPCDVDLGDTAA